MNQRTVRALVDLTAALYEEGGSGDVVLLLSPDAFAAIVPPQTEAGLKAYAIRTGAGTVTIRMERE